MSSIQNSTVETVSEIRLEDLDWLATGAGILGTGGGGDPRLGRLRLNSIFDNDDYPDYVEIISPEELNPDATVASVGGMGAPTISREKFPKGDEDLKSLRAIETASGDKMDAIIPGEIGGANSMAPLCVAALTGLPVVDGDGMGRAFPELQMDTFFIYGTPVNFAANTDEHGNQVAYQNIQSAAQLEKFARSITVNMGGRSGYAFPIMKGSFVSEYAIADTVSLARELGRRVHEGRDGGSNPITAIKETLDANALFTGKIVDVFRRNREGFAFGEVSISALDQDDSLTVKFQNEFLIARDADDTILASVPDLICIVDKDTGDPITTGSLRYGQRVKVLGVPAPKLLKTDAALDVIGPGAFGYDIEYQQLSENSAIGR